MKKPKQQGVELHIDWSRVTHNRHAVLVHAANIMGRRHPFLKTNDGTEVAFIDQSDADFFRELLARNEPKAVVTPKDKT